MRDFGGVGFDYMLRFQIQGVAGSLRNLLRKEKMSWFIINKSIEILKIFQFNDLSYNFIKTNTVDSVET